ncbi:MAG: twin-arginine translocase subunit TatC [Bacteroidales bacterium]|jgi:sec-independent protein translocase protein TatC|nr:twin-arginine translocase subunit TatC [Bacteroidales bacterium]
MAKKSSNTGEMSFLEHLEELRWHIVRSVITIVAFAVVAFIFSRFIFDYILLAPKNPDFFSNRLLCQLAEILHTPALCINTKTFEVINIKMAGQFSANIMISLYAGLIIAFPFVIWEMWKFISPALYVNERKHARGSVAAISILFFIGALFGYYVIVPLSVHFLGGWQVSEQVISRIDLNSYVSTVTFIPFSTGIIFELPILMVFLTKVGIITPAFMIQYRRHAIIVLMIVAAVITPPDVFSMILVVLPLVLLYEVSILLTKRTAKKYRQTMAEEEAAK